MRPFQPLSQNCLYASLNPAGVLTVPSSRRFAPSRSPAALSGSRTLVANLAASSRIAATVSGAASSNPGQLGDLRETGELVHHEVHFGRGA